MMREQFEQLPVAERARLILAKKVQFVRDGQLISASEALGRDTWRTNVG